MYIQINNEDSFYFKILINLHDFICAIDSTNDELQETHQGYQPTVAIQSTHPINYLIYNLQLLIKKTDSLFFTSSQLGFNREVFDWRNPTGFIFAYIIEQSVSAYITMVAASLIIHGFGSIWIFLAFVDDMCIELISLNDYKKTKKNPIIIYKHLCSIIHFQNQIKKLSLSTFN